MKRALISDIHSNLEGLEAVLADIRAQGITEIFCLGDIIGYGPNPRECIDLVMKCKMCLLGNHDQGALFDPEGFNSGAERAIFWTREQLESQRGNAEDTICSPKKLERSFALVQRCCFQGHTHVPGVFTEGMNFLSPEEINFQYHIGNEKAMINVGSVGQPRDGDPRSCYVVQEDDKITYRRVEYPAEKTRQKIHDIPELDNFLGDRLLEGR